MTPDPEERRQAGVAPAASMPALLAGTLLAGTLLAGALGLLAGCGATPSAEKEANALSPAEVAARLAEADTLYREPRAVVKVGCSLDAALAAAPSDPSGEALWRASRACAWLADHHPQEEARSTYAERGAAFAEQAVARSPESPAPYFYQALNLGLLSRITDSGFFRIGPMRRLAEKVIALDEKFEHAGGQRFLGKLCWGTRNIPLVAAGSGEDAFRHLRRACELFPDYGLNQLSLAETLLEDGKTDEARARLLLVIGCPVPPDETEEHAAWVETARTLLPEVTPP